MTGADLPWMPPARHVRLAGRQELLVRDSGGDAPTLVLLHGWMATADLNFGFQYRALARDFRVVAFDQRGHGRGLPTGWRFDFRTCADDVAAVLDALGIDRAIAVGYSMGGPVALRFAERHAERTAGLVLCATSGAFNHSPVRRVVYGGFTPLVGLAGLVPDNGLRRSARARFISRRADGPRADWIAEQLAPSDVAAIGKAGIALARFNAYPWLGAISTPTVSVCTVDDTLVAPGSQRALARSLGAVTTLETTGGHTTCFDHPDRFTPVLADACTAVARGADTPVRS